MNPFEALRSTSTQYAGFTGRARRSELWWFVLVVLVAYGALALLDDELGTNGILTTALALVLLLPYLALNARRLHDIDKSGWWQLMYLLPVLGVVVFVLWGVRDSVGDNRFGPDPRAGHGHTARSQDRDRPGR